MPAIEELKVSIKALHEALAFGETHTRLDSELPQWDPSQRILADDVELAVRTLINQQLQITIDLYMHNQSSYLELQEAIKDEEMRYNVVLNTIFEHLVKGVDKQSLDEFNGTFVLSLSLSAVCCRLSVSLSLLIYCFLCLNQSLKYAIR